MAENVTTLSENSQAGAPFPDRLLSTLCIEWAPHQVALFRSSSPALFPAPRLHRSQLEWPGSNRPLLYELRQAGIGKHQLNKRLLTAALVGSFGGFIFGYDLGALSASTQSLRGQWHLSPALFGLTVSSSLWGTVCGALFSGRVADRLSRRHLIAGCSVLYALAAIGIALPIQSSWMLVPAMRFLCGMAIAGFTVACPLYLAEISPIALRGRLVSLFQVQVGVGVLVAFSVGLVVIFSRTG